MGHIHVEFESSNAEISTDRRRGEKNGYFSLFYTRFGFIIKEWRLESIRSRTGIGKLLHTLGNFAPLRGAPKHSPEGRAFFRTLSRTSEQKFPDLPIRCYGYISPKTVRAVAVEGGFNCGWDTQMSPYIE